MFAAACLLSLTGCKVKVSDTSTNELAGEIIIDGSSTVLPISQAVAEEFHHQYPDVSISVTGSGTSSGFKRLIAGDVDIADASRPITPKEIEQLAAQNIDTLELPVAIDGLSVAVSKENDWCKALTVAQLRDLWKDGTITKWNQLDPSWPDAPIKLYGAGANSGTFDYFTEVVNGKKGMTREDYNQSENDNELVIGIAGDKYALGYFGYSYFDENRDSLNAVKIAPGDDLSQAVEPTEATIESGTYTPLSRPIFIYVKLPSLKRSEVQAYVDYYLSDKGQALVTDAHCIRMNSKQLEETRARYADALKALTQADAERP